MHIFWLYHLSTTGILTKPDLVDKGTEETVVDIVHNEIIHLTKGYMIVRCRGQKEILDQVTLNEATVTEKAFFQDHLHFRWAYYYLYYLLRVDTIK